jgi:LysR family glycine cleavage system transcriptional activator
MRLPSLKFLKTFQVAGNRASFKLAAAEMFITPSAVSHQIKGLERHLGVILFERGTRSLKLTDAGARYLKQIDDVFARLESVTEQLQVRYGRTIVRLHAPPFFASEMLLPRLASFSQAHEALDILIETSVPHPRAHAPEADLSVVVGTGPWDGLVAHPLFAQNFVPACSPGLLASTPIHSVSDLDAGTLIVDEGRRDDWDRWAYAHGLAQLRPGQLLRLDTMSAVIRAAEKGLGVALVPAALSARRFNSGRLTRLFDAELETHESYVLLARPEDARRDEVDELTRWILSECCLPSAA